MKRVVGFTLFAFVLYYLVLAFILGSFDIMESSIAIARFLMTIFGILVWLSVFWIVVENKEFFFPPVVPHNEKIQEIKKYTWELKEELQLYSEANELEQKAKELRKKHWL